MQVFSIAHARAITVKESREEKNNACERPTGKRRRRDALRITTSRLQGRSPGLRVGNG
jgi:hypothetical protein